MLIVALNDRMLNASRGTESGFFHQPASVAAPARSLLHGTASPANGCTGHKAGAEKHLSAERMNLDKEHSPSVFRKGLPATCFRCSRVCLTSDRGYGLFLNEAIYLATPLDIKDSKKDSLLT